MSFSFSPCALENLLYWGKRTKQYQVLWICNISKTGTTQLYRDKTEPLNMATLYSHTA
jgi:hypothetical protein